MTKKKIIAIAAIIVTVAGAIIAYFVNKTAEDDEYFND